MEFLKDVLGEHYDEFKKRLSDYNTLNPDKAVKLANLSEGGYVDKDKYSALKLKHEKEVQRLVSDAEGMKKDYAISLLLDKQKPRNAKAVKALLDMENISYNDGVLSGFEEQIKKVREENPYLFEGGEQAPVFIRPVSGGVSEMTRDDFKKLSYMEKLKLKREAPEQYSKLKQEDKTWQHI